MYIYIYIYIYTHTHTYILIYISVFYVCVGCNDGEIWPGAPLARVSVWGLFYRSRCSFGGVGCCSCRCVSVSGVLFSVGAWVCV